MFTSGEIIRQVQAHLHLRNAHLREPSTVDVGTFADGEPASNGAEVLSAAKEMLRWDHPRIHHMGISTIGFKHQEFLPAFQEAAEQFARGRLRLHYSYYGPGEVHERFVPPPSPPAAEVLPNLAALGNATGFPVTLNIPMIRAETATEEHMLRCAEELRPYQPDLRMKLSSFNEDESGSLVAADADTIRRCAECLKQEGFGVKIFIADSQDDGSHVDAGCGRLNLYTRTRTGHLMSGSPSMESEV